MNYAPINRAAEFAQKAQINCEYKGQPYDVHNKGLREVLKRFGFKEETYPHLHAAGELHDVFEDTDATPQQALQYGIDKRPIMLALLVTDEPGKNRTEKKTKTYPKTASDPESIILKLADRITNVEKGGKHDMYKHEHPTFYKMLYKEDASKQTKRMWSYLNTIIGYDPKV